MLMSKSRHKKPENVRRYAKPSPEAISELTAFLRPVTRGAEVLPRAREMTRREHMRLGFGRLPHTIR
ncbi:hypothetical protein ADL35_14555 [Streptomyces sp. NRRL WC-3753]|nr:hypothetical protein ADL35_14555 [Streptomyces sp. NRRL WC-3753]